MECPYCKRIMQLEDGDIMVCNHCEIGIKLNPKKNCEHDTIILGINGMALCDDCGIILAYK